MTVTYAELKAMLDVDEPNYPALAAAAAGAMGHLQRMATSADPGLAAKAVSLAGIIGGAESLGVVSRAAKSRDPVVRVAAGNAAASLPESPDAARIVSTLLTDKDIGVVKVATRAAASHRDPAVAAKARKASARLDVAARAAAKKPKEEGTTNMASKATGAKKTTKSAKGTTKSAKGTAKKAARGLAAGGGMPTGAMESPAKGVKRGKMPTGTMR